MKKLLAAIPFAFLAFPALAADVVYEEPPAPAAELPIASTWAGFYAGVQAGYAFGGSNGIFTLDRNQDGIFGDNLPAFDPLVNPAAGGFSGQFDEGFIGGGHIGYDWQAGNIVFGGLIDITGTNISDQQSGFSATPAFYTIDRQLDYLFTARARLGYAFGDRFLAYATGGFAYGDVETTFLSNTPAFTTVTSLSDDDIGYTVGGGLETKVTSKISVGLEYLYTNLGSNNVLVNLSGNPGTGAGNAFGTGGANSTNAKGSEDDFDFHTVQVKLSYHF